MLIISRLRLKCGIGVTEVHYKLYFVKNLGMGGNWGLLWPGELFQSQTNTRPYFCWRVSACRPRTIASLRSVVHHVRPQTQAQRDAAPLLGENDTARAGSELRCKSLPRTISGTGISLVIFGQKYRGR